MLRVHCPDRVQAANGFAVAGKLAWRSEWDEGRRVAASAARGRMGSPGVLLGKTWCAAREDQQNRS